MKHFKTPNFFASIAILIVLLLVGCDNESNLNGQTVSIANEDAFISFSAGTEADVIFNHKVHSEQYWDNNCFECHSHGDVRDTTQWQCSECHSNEDAEGLCADDANNHDCMYVQCKRCHDTINPDPTPNCTDCHVTVASGLFLDSAVQGLTYVTATQGGTTDSAGTFQYIPGETITFSIGGVVLGSIAGKDIITPVDLIPGATDETHHAVTNIARFLMTLDTDNDPDTGGITLPDDILNVVQNMTIDFDVDTALFGNDPNLQAILTALGNKPLCTAAEAQTHLAATLLSMNSAPVASSVTISGSAVVDHTVTGSYLYVDENGDTESGSTFRWLLADDTNGTNMAVIAGATTQTYTIIGADTNRYLFFEVTPGASSGQTPGTAVLSDPVLVSALAGNTAPSAIGCTISGTPNTNFILIVDYQYDDPDGDLESGTTIQWYTTDASGTPETPISGATSATYIPSAGQYLRAKVIPAAASGNSPGPTCTTGDIGPVGTANSLEVYGTLASQNEVDSYTFRLASSANVTIDVESYETTYTLPEWYGHMTGPKGGPCGGCHGHPTEYGPNQIFPGTGAVFPDDNADDKLITNIYLFNVSDPATVDLNDLVEDAKFCLPGGTYFDCTPGTGAPGDGSTRSNRNPYLSFSTADTPQDPLPAGDYTLRLGAAPLNITGARIQNNLNGAHYRTNGGTAYYKVTFNIN